MKREWKQFGNWHFYGDDGAAVVWASYKSADLYKGGQRSPLRYTGPTALADAKAAAEKALTPVDPLDAEAEEFANSCFVGGDPLFVSVRGLAAAYKVFRLGKDKPTVPAPAIETVIPENVEPDDVAQLYCDRPDLCRLIDATINHTLEIVATNLGVESFDAGDGSEDFWGDVGGSVVNLLREAGLEDYCKPAEPAPETPIYDSPEGFARSMIRPSSLDETVIRIGGDDYPWYGAVCKEHFDEEEVVDARRGIAAALKARDARENARKRAAVFDYFNRRSTVAGFTINDVIAALDAAGL